MFHKKNFKYFAIVFLVINFVIYRIRCDEECICEYDENIEEDKNEKNEFYPKHRSLFDYVKTFWRSITFTIGVVICLCALYCLTAQIANSNDAVVYSIWLLIGVILIK